MFVDDFELCCKLLKYLGFASLKGDFLFYLFMFSKQNHYDMPFAELYWSGMKEEWGRKSGYNGKWFPLQQKHGKQQQTFTTILLGPVWTLYSLDNANTIFGGP